MFIFDTKISNKKRIDIALLECFGLNHSSTEKILAKLGYNFGCSKRNFRKNLKSKLNLEVFIPEVVRRHVKQRVGVFLKHLLFLQMRRLRRLKTLRSFRHSLFLPVRGQRTHKNAKTQKLKKRDRKKIPIPRKKK